MCTKMMCYDGIDLSLFMVMISFYRNCCNLQTSEYAIFFMEQLLLGNEAYFINLHIR